MLVYTLDVLLRHDPPEDTWDVGRTHRVRLCACHNAEVAREMWEAELRAGAPMELLICGVEECGIPVCPSCGRNPC